MRGEERELAEANELGFRHRGRPGGFVTPKSMPDRRIWMNGLERSDQNRPRRASAAGDFVGLVPGCGLGAGEVPRDRARILLLQAELSTIAAGPLTAAVGRARKNSK